MSEELITPPNFMENIREKIKNSFAELVPDETWDAMVKQEIDNFFEAPTNFKVRTDSNGWGENTSKTHDISFEGEIKPTMFRSMVWSLCAEKTAEYLNREHIQNIVETALEERKDDATGKTESLIQKAIPMMVNQYFENIARNMTNNLSDMIRSNIENGAYQRY